MPFCPICSEVVEDNNYKEVYVSPYNKEQYKRYECSSCDVHWWEPMKIMPDFYENEIFDGYLSFHLGIRKLPKWTECFFAHFPINHGKLLDVGCGEGLFLEKTLILGFEVFGIDFDKNSVKVAKQRLDINTIYPMSLNEFYQFAIKNNLKFDVITFFEVLEHQDRPMEFLKIVRDLLKDGGYVAGSVPNRNRLFADISWKYFHGDFPPHHFLRFSDIALKNVLELSGFRAVEIYKLDFSFFDIPPYIEKKLFGNLDFLKGKLKAKSVKNDRLALSLRVEDITRISKNKVFFALLKLMKKVRNALLLPFALPYLTKLKGNGPNIYFQARKG